MTFDKVIDIWEQFSLKLSENYGSFRQDMLDRREDDNYEVNHDNWSDERETVDSMALGMYEGLCRYTFETDGRGDMIDDIINSYVEHVAANLCLSDTLNATIHDWEDIGPVYQTTFSRDLRFEDYEELEQQRLASELLTVMFPDFEAKSVKSLAKIIDDPRIDSLRDLIAKASIGKMEFDIEFANARLREVLKTENKIGKIRNVVGWLAKPLGFIPYLGFAVDTLAEKGAGKLIEKRERENLSWFYLLSEVAK